MGVVVGMARGVQHHVGGEPGTRVPAVRRADRLQLAVGAQGAAQPVVLDVIRQEELHLRIGRQRDMCPDARPAEDREAQAQQQQPPADVGGVGGPAALATPLDVAPFLPVALAETADPGARPEVVEAFAGARGVGVGVGGGEAVVNLAMRRGVMAEQQRDVDPFAEGEEDAVGAVDQLVGVGVRHLPEEQRSGDVERQPARRPQTAGGQRADCQRQQGDVQQRQHHRERVGAVQRAGRVGGAVGPLQELVEGEGHDGDEGQRRPDPAAAQRRGEQQQECGGQRRQREAENGHGGLHWLRGV